MSGLTAELAVNGGRHTDMSAQIGQPGWLQPNSRIFCQFWPWQGTRAGLRGGLLKDLTAATN